MKAAAFPCCCCPPVPSTSPSGLQAHRQIVAVLLAAPRAGGIHQRRFTLRHPLDPQFCVCPEMSLVDKEYLCPGAPRLVPQGGVLRHEGLPFGLVRIDQLLLGALEGKPQPVQVVQATAAAQPDAQPFRRKTVGFLSNTSWQVLYPPRRAVLHRPFQLHLPRLVKGGGNHRSVQISGLQALPHRRPTPNVRQ